MRVNSVAVVVCGYPRCARDSIPSRANLCAAFISLSMRSQNFPYGTLDIGRVGMIARVGKHRELVSMECRGRSVCRQLLVR
jgi:hypothetical protein